MLYRAAVYPGSAGQTRDEATRKRALETLELTSGLRLSGCPSFTTRKQFPGIRETGGRCAISSTISFYRTVVRREGDPPTADAAVNEAYDNAGITYDFFEDVFGRRSIDGKDMRLLSSVHYSKHYDNAFWDGKQMVYGDGDGVVFGSFTNAIDVIAHELTHGVTQMTCGLAYHGESGRSTSRSPTCSARWSSSGISSRRSKKRTG